MDTEMELKIYELAYHVTSNLEEAQVKASVEELANLITNDGGTILISREPKRIHLSYPIKRQQYAYFGIFDFKAPAETIEKLGSQMKLQNNIIRYLLMKKPPEGKEIRTLGETKSRRSKPKTFETKKEVPMTPAEKVEVETKTKAMEEELEEVIKGL
jgi:small subunit ribosomal protein S6